MNQEEIEKKGPDKGSCAGGRDPVHGQCPQVTFTGFLLSLNAAALVHLGELPQPGTDTREKDLVLAKNAIDTIAMIQEKTTGNLTPDEKSFVELILFDLRMKYVKASS